MRPFPEAVRRSILIGFAAGLVGGLASLVPCSVLPFSEACSWSGEFLPPEIE